MGRSEMLPERVVVPSTGGGGEPMKVGVMRARIARVSESQTSSAGSLPCEDGALSDSGQPPPSY